MCRQTKLINFTNKFIAVQISDLSHRCKHKSNLEFGRGRETLESSQLGSVGSEQD